MWRTTWVGGIVGGVFACACAVNAGGEEQVGSRTDELSLLGCHDAVDCKGGLLCEVAECVLGQCLYLPLLGCDVAPPSSVGSCSASSECSDGRGCTLDLCVEAEGMCVHAAVDGCCESDADCETDLLCSVGLCLNHRCVLDVDLGCGAGEGPSGAVGRDCRDELDCDDGNPCTLDVCVEPLGLCTHVGLASCEEGGIVVDVGLDLPLDEMLDEVLDDDTRVSDAEDAPASADGAGDDMRDPEDPARMTEGESDAGDGGDPEPEALRGGACSLDGAPGKGSRLPWLLGLLGFLGLARLSSREEAQAESRAKARKFGFGAGSRNRAAVRSEGLEL